MRRLLRSSLLPGSLVAFHACDQHYASGNEPAPRDSSSPRVLTVHGTAHERGVRLWQAFGADATKLTALRRDLYSAAGNEKWAAFGLFIEEAWQSHAPVSWSELKGMISAGASRPDLLALATDFEMQMCAWKHDELWNWDWKPPEESQQPSEHGRCTAFAVSDALAGGAMCGQNVDEDPSAWADGRKDVVVRLLSTEPTVPHAAVYTHPGVPAYCGLNGAGLCVMNLFLADKGEDSQSADSPSEAASILGPRGLPIDVTIRELLTHTTIEGAVRWLESIPRAAPSAYMLIQGDVIATVEASPERAATLWLRGRGCETCHSNHALCDQRMNAAPPAPQTSEVSANEASTTAAPNPSDTNERLRHMQRAVREARRGGVDGLLDISAARRILTETPPAHATYAPTSERKSTSPIALVRNCSCLALTYLMGAPSDLYLSRQLPASSWSRRNG